MISRMALSAICWFCVPLVWASPEEDRVALSAFYQQRLPAVPLEEHINGIYAFDAGSRAQWLEMEEFPPYEIGVELGEELFKIPFANGKGYSDCFPDAQTGVRQKYPYFDEDLGEVVTLEWDINRCREANGEAPLPYLRGELAQISAYLSFLSRGQITQVEVSESAAAQKAYEAGKAFYYTRRGQLNFACSSCHLQSVGQKLRAEPLSAMLGQTTHWPVYRSKWEELGTLQWRIIECNSQVRAEPLEAQSRAYRELEFFLTYMSNGLPLNGPATRR